MSVSLDERIASKQRSNTCLLTSAIIGGCIGSALIVISTVGILYAQGHLSKSFSVTWIKDLSSHQQYLGAALSIGVITLGGTVVYVAFYYCYKNKQIAKEECIKELQMDFMNFFEERYFRTNPAANRFGDDVPNKTCFYTYESGNRDWHVSFKDKNVIYASRPCNNKEKDGLILFLKADGFNIQQIN